MAIACSVFQAAEQLYKPLVYTVYSGLNNGAFTGVSYGLIDLVGGLFVKLFNKRGVDASIRYQLFKGLSGYLAANRVKAGNCDSFRSVVYDKIDPCNSLNSAYVSSSRPMIRPFISSFGRGTTDMVASAAWSAAQR